MTSVQRGSFDAADYERTVKAVNTGYDLLFTLVYCFLRALRDPELDLLVVGAGGGMEIERFLPDNPAWRLTGVDPSQPMLALAQARAEARGVASRTTLLPGSVEDLPAERRFSAATCVFVLHFLPDDQKLALLRATANRLRPEAPLLVASAARVDDQSLRDDFLGAWQQHGELMGLPPERMAATIEQLLAQHASLTSIDDYERLLHAAGFKRVAPFFSVMAGAMTGWIAR
ncbi:MAG: class I SAM-dependent methyltransferase [Acidobacteriota bacterium]